MGALATHPYPCGQPNELVGGWTNTKWSKWEVTINQLRKTWCVKNGWFTKFTSTVKQPNTVAWRVQFDPLGGLMSAMQKLALFQMKQNETLTQSQNKQIKPPEKDRKVMKSQIPLK